uniref:putative F-box protein At1g50870 n=1 Tax=Fragaria vesca subsp. vesca TaxID=101020 RepID=UPI0005CA4C50|nr:PREDICTED: putative F-box protein At1g50870 [Fragaria vesca subsp. vesca]
MAGGILMHRSNFLKRCIDLLKTLSNIWMVRNTLTELDEDVTGGETDGDPNTRVTTLTNLPEDVTSDILMRLPVESLCRVQCVSKTSLDISRSPDFATLHNLQAATDASPMRVTTWCSGTSVLQAWQSFKYNSIKQTLTKSVHVFQIGSKQYDFEVDFVFCNLVFLKTLIRHGSDGFGPCLLVNPLREEVLELPLSNIPVPTTNTDSGDDTDWYGMGYDNITSTYKIVHVRATNNCAVAQVFVVGTSSWRQIPLAPPFDESTSFSGKRSNNAIYVGGHMHWLVYRKIESLGYMISFNFNREEFCATLVPSSNYGTYGGLHLLEFRGSLALVDVHRPDVYYNIKIWVLKSYDDEKKWELHHNITMKCLLPIWTSFPAWSTFREFCAEWEHGICLASEDQCYFLDLRNLSMKIEQLPPYSTPGYRSKARCIALGFKHSLSFFMMSYHQ